MCLPGTERRGRHGHPADLFAAGSRKRSLHWRGFQINDGDIKVTRGFTIHCDNILTNNLEINWAGGNNFHIDKESLTTVTCTKPSVPNPPDADVSRIVATSPGTCNGLPATIAFVLEDRGEP